MIPPRMSTRKPDCGRKMAMGLSTAVSVQDLRCFDFKDTRGFMAECSPSGLLEEGLSSSDSPNSSKASTSGSVTRSISSRWHGFFRLFRQYKSLRRLSSFPPPSLRKLSRKISHREPVHALEPDPALSGDTGEFCFFKPTWKSFTISELQKATNNFSPENLIGRGGYSGIYKGCLENGQHVAVKRLTRGTEAEQTHTFLSEMGILVHIYHPNLAKLIGVGVEGGMYLVFELSPHGSLENLFHDPKQKLDWGVRYKVAIGTAAGLEYLHERCQRRIIHRDIKPANILLTADFEPQICDFGLAKWLPDELSHRTLSNFEGTFGYLAPEYCMHGVVNEKTDVFAFGIVLLELITGHRAVDTARQSLLTWAKPLLEANCIKDLVDPSLGSSYDCNQLHRAAKAAYMCVQHSSILRPRMSQVLRLLRGEEGRSVNTNAIQKPLIRRTYFEEIYDAEEYNAMRNLNDIRRHRQIAFDF